MGVLGRVGQMSVRGDRRARGTRQERGAEAGRALDAFDLHSALKPGQGTQGLGSTVQSLGLLSHCVRHGMSSWSIHPGIDSGGDTLEKRGRSKANIVKRRTQICMNF